jgi:hypothetical protein
MSERERYWRSVLEQWRASGTSRAAFCRRHGISYHSLSQWKSRIGADAKVGPGGRRRFVEIAVPRAAVPSYEIALAGGRSLRVPPGFDDGEVARLIAVVESC